MNNKILNKQISIETIIKVAEYLEKYKEEYDKKFELEEIKNKTLPYTERIYEYENGNTTIKYTISFKNGKTITESEYNWFIQNLEESSIIKNISIDLYITYYTKNPNTIDNVNNIFNKVNISLYFREFDASIDIDTMNQEKEAHNVYSDVIDILNDNEDRYNKTIKYRKLRVQSFCVSIGILLSYILYFILNLNINKLSPTVCEIFNNKYVLIIGQWFVSILLGNLASYWFILSIYKPLLPDTKYAGYNSSTYKSVYKDDIDDYIEHSEVHFGKYYDADKRRKKIEKIYKITSKILIIQLVISIILFFILN